VRYARRVADIEKRGRYTPRRAREQRAYRLIVTGGVAGAVGVVTLVLAVAGVIGAGIPVIALIVAAICLVLFRQAVGSR
jgi:putative flippase GtrA